ncbi:putative disease resistance RPP13-like protein 1 [Pyrus x bretschneideri]|uniref:putative disease resistance RPP13-like protein 1 n=1 Tax=Pyrus x bretschneideri TaxID=225117 RepID=UPI00202E834A|nr:putative disease resistance RPP13-like protein 1 [Pyrus x bretschneideri]
MAGTLTILSMVFSSGITSAILQVVVCKLADLAFEKIGRSDEVSGKLQQLARRLQKIDSLVEDLENKQTNSNACEELIEDFKNALLDAEDLLDRIDLEKPNFRDIDPSRLKSDDKRELSRLLKRVDGLVKEMEGFFLSEINRQRRPPQSLDVNPRTSSLVDELSVFGRGNEKQEMVEMLLAERREDVSVIPIVGMGGTGKTTLAQLVYNNEAVVREFELRMWVCFSSLDTDLVTVTKSIYESATKEVLELSNLDAVQVALQEKMRMKKFLLVLDGMWNENSAFWEVLKLPFKFAAPGSNIVVTTRSKIVSSIVSTGRHYHLHTFSGGSGHEACWEIIKQSLGGNLDGYEDLQNVGLEIAKKCKGLPLAAKAIGRALRLKLEKEWDHILNCELWDFPEDYMRQIYPVLKVSYDHLPAYLKRCFAYCSIFPHNFQFEEDDLIQLWAAEGFIQPQKTRSVEGIGREYFDFLLSGSLFQVSSNAAGGRKYEMHEFNHDLARLVSTNLCFRLEDSMSTFLPTSRNVRHSSLLCQDIKPSTLEQYHRYKKLRTFILLPRDPTSLSEVPHDFFSKLPCLRVLNLSRSQITELPESIGKLMHLRYLNLNDTLIRRLPKSLADICRLEILKLKNCSKLHELPKNLKNLSKLRHLDFDRPNQISSWPKNLGKLTLLETLPEFRVGKDKGCKIEELKNMTCLRGSLSIKNLENVADVAEAEGAILHNKQYLESLGLHWNNGTRDATVEEAVLEGLKPHDRLKRLQVAGYLGSNFPDWIGQSSFCKLESIRLEKCQLCTVLPSLGQLPVLKELVIEKMGALTDVVRHFCGLAGSFPSLETLTFCDMPKLRIWSGINETDMPRLTELCIDSCQNLVALPSLHHLTSLETLDINGCPQLLSIPGEGLPRSLKHLSISDSDILKERCKGRDGADWNKIRWIPEIVIDGDEIPMDGRGN